MFLHNHIMNKCYNNYNAKTFNKNKHIIIFFSMGQNPKDIVWQIAH